TTPTGSGGRAGSAVRVRIARVQRRALRRGLRVRCRAAGAGRCTVIARARGKVVARGSRKVKVGREVTVVAKLTAVARRALRKNGRLRVKVTVRAPGAGPVKKSVLLRP
ncbi:MAG: hypothetical protein H0V29_01680, partial [Thermoleophilaceae bacterium]|nr:hypothetical protein [Thermoleophilaceae bacterium]